LKIADLEKREADIALRGSKPTSGRLVARRVGTIVLDLFASADYLRSHGRPSGPEVDLSPHRLVGLDKRFEGAPEMRWLSGRSAGAPRFVLRSTNVGVLERAVSEGVGMGVLPSVFARGNDRIECVVPSVVTREVWMIVPADVKKEASIRAVMDWIAATFRNRDTS
jgi:DNA-binding transcriptional LysR family regulator